MACNAFSRVAPERLMVAPRKLVAFIDVCLCHHFAEQSCSINMGSLHYGQHFQRTELVLCIFMPR